MTTPPVPPDPARVRAWEDALFGGLLRSTCAAERVLGVERWAGYCGAPQDVVPLLSDDAPVVREHAGLPHLVEVRAVALVALQDVHRAAGGWPYGPVTVGRAMPAHDALGRAHALADRPDAAALRAAAARWLDARVGPPPADREACLAYGVLRAAGLLEHEVQDVDPVTLLTPLQAAVHASQLVSQRPLPHVVLGDGDRVVGYLYRAGGWVVDTDESPAGRAARTLVVEVLRDELARPHPADDVAVRLRAVADRVARVLPARFVDDP